MPSTLGRGGVVSTRTLTSIWKGGLENKSACSVEHAEPVLNSLDTRANHCRPCAGLLASCSAIAKMASKMRGEIASRSVCHC
jgi:hypothetical protein